MPIKRSEALVRDLVRLDVALNIKDKLNGRTLVPSRASRDLRVYFGTNHELHGRIA